MISLEDRIHIQTTPQRVFTWLEKMPQTYCAWHPDHVACQIVHGSMLEPGSEMECQEILHGKLHKMRFRMTKVVPGKRLEFDVLGMGRGAFEVQPVGDSVNFIAELSIGTEAAVIGPLFDWIFLRLFQGRINAMKQHMAEEGINLKATLEKAASNP